MGEGVEVFYRLQLQTRGLNGQVLAEGPVEEGGRRYCINSAALRSVRYEELQAQGYGAYRELRNQAATTEGAKR